MLAGCSGGNPSGPSPSMDAGDPVSARCAELTAQTNDWFAAHRGCNVEGDCTGEPAYGFIYDKGSNVSCWPAVVLSTDGVNGFLSLLGQLSDAKCEGPTRICSGLFPVPTCRDHVCSYP
jgi:hypothetical protein